MWTFKPEYIAMDSVSENVFDLEARMHQPNKLKNSQNVLPKKYNRRVPSDKKTLTTQKNVEILALAHLYNILKGLRYQSIIIKWMAIDIYCILFRFHENLY
jgi:hypothetical protein